MCNAHYEYIYVHHIPMLEKYSFRKRKKQTYVRETTIRPKNKHVTALYLFLCRSHPNSVNELAQIPTHIKHYVHA